MRLLTYLVCIASAAAHPMAQVHAPAPHRAVIEEAVYVDDVFSPHERLLIQGALDGWNVAAGTSIHYRVAGTFKHDSADAVVAAKAKLPDTIVITKEEPTVEDLVAFSHGDAVPVAHVDDIPGHTVYVINYFGQETPALVSVLMHELGHIQGLVHLPVRTSLMYPISNEQPCVDTTTLLELAVLRPELDRSGWVVSCPED